MTPAKEVQFLMPRNCEYATFHGRRDFADVIKILEMEIKRVLLREEEMSRKSDVRSRDWSDAIARSGP